MRRIILLVGYFLLFAFSPVTSFSQNNKALRFHKTATKNLQNWRSPHTSWNHIGSIKIDSFSIHSEENKIEFLFNTQLSYLPIRETNYQLTINSLKECLGRRFRDYEISIETDGQLMESLIPNYYRKSIEIDQERIQPASKGRIPVVRNISDAIPSMGLYNKNIALWHSHGWYYDAKLDRWEWQRAKLFTTVEDIFPMTFVLPYIVPMLENAGANVFLPRERDTQQNEVIVDNDGSTSDSDLSSQLLGQDTISTNGFMKKDTLFFGENPFKLGTHLRFRSSNTEYSYLEYIPKIPEDGKYAVYVAYVQSEENISNARYTVIHTGGKSEFLVNQKIGGSTWIYLGTFHFKKGKESKFGSVQLSRKSNEDGWITADAVRFGGGMGNIARKPLDAQTSKISWKTSQRPKYLEGARYYLQYSGVPESLVYSLNDGKNDYNDDYQSRGEWVNYLIGSPSGPNMNRDSEGLNVPIDLSLAFHTDAGTTAKDSIIGTLGIYSSIRDNGKFPNGQSKMANRDLTDIIQSEIVHDIRKQFNPKWTRRGLWNKQYSEAWRPNIPAMLLELLSHQNLSDISFGHDPRFKFAISRAIYKGMVKFLSEQNNSTYMIQPLPVDHFSMKRIGQKSIQLSWKPVLDSLEQTAKPSYYKLYQRVGNSGFDNGRVVGASLINIELDQFDTIYSFKVTAINAGGESFPSEILSVGLVDNDKPSVLVVNGFDRVAAPSIIDKGNFAGLSYWNDEGVPDKFDIGFTGYQYDFNRKSEWLDDDSPGWGASYGNMEGKLIPGNSFDNTFTHGQAIMAAGYSFVSTSDEAFVNQDFELDDYNTIDLIFGEEKTTKTFSGSLYKVFDEGIQNKIEAFTAQGGNVFASGAYIGSDHILNEDTTAQKFANDVLHFKWRTNHAVRNGEIRNTDYSKTLFSGEWKFNTSYHTKFYKVEAPDAIEPIGIEAISAFRYHENNTSAGVVYNGDYKTVILGFPFETIVDEEERNLMMKQVLHFFK